MDDSKPIFIQLAEEIEGRILEGIYPEGTQVPSTNEFAAFMRINPATAGKGLNRLVDAGTRVVQLGYEGTEGAEVESLVDRAQQEIFAVANQRSSEDYRLLEDLISPTVDELIAIQRDGLAGARAGESLPKVA